MFKSRNLNPSGEKFERANSLLNVFTSDKDFKKGARLLYMQGIDANKDGSISDVEFARALQRADKELFGDVKDIVEIKENNNGLTEATELQIDFAKHGAIPFLLDEAQKHSPQKYKQIKDKLSSGEFTLTGKTEETDTNVLKQPIGGLYFSDSILRSLFRYEKLTDKAPKFKQAFFDKLAEGQVPFYDYEPDKLTAISAQPDEKTGIVSIKEETFDINNPERLLQTLDDEKYSLNYPIITTPASIPGTCGDNLEKEALEKIRKDVLSDKNLKYYEDNILDAMESDEKLIKFEEKIGKDIGKALNINISFAQYSNADNNVSFYNWDKNELLLNYASLKAIREQYEKIGVPTNKLKQELVIKLLGTLSHEYMHAIQDKSIETEQHNTKLAEYRENSNNYMEPEISMRAFGSYLPYREQVLEKSANILGTYVQNYTRSRYAKQNQSCEAR